LAIWRPCQAAGRARGRRSAPRTSVGRPPAAGLSGRAEPADVGRARRPGRPTSRRPTGAARGPTCRRSWRAAT